MFPDNAQQGWPLASCLYEHTLLIKRESNQKLLSDARLMQNSWGAMREFMQDEQIPVAQR